jgi:multiple sugar transport system substrate-binding protein
MRSIVRYVIAAALLSASCFVPTAVSAADEPRYDGTGVTVAMHSGHFVATWEAFNQQVKDKLGIDMTYVGIPVNELFDKEMLEFSGGSGAYDLIMFNPAWMGDYVDFLRPLDDYMMKWDPAWEDIHPGFRANADTYGGKRYTIHMDGDVILGYYRKDLFDDPKEKEAFKAKHGYDLAPPTDWKQVLDIQSFFTRDTNGDGKVDMWGYADQPKRGRSFYWFLLRYLALAGDNPQYFDAATMAPKINSPEGVVALENYAQAVKNGPTGVLGWEWDELINAFLGGQVAMIFHWPDEGKRGEQLAKNVPGGKMGFFLPPKRSMSFGGWVMGVSKDSKNPEAAYAAMRELLSPETSLKMVTNPNSGQDFFRVSHFNSDEVKKAVPPEYLETFNKSIAQVFPELRIPGGFEYYDALDVQVQRALAGEASPKNALDEAAKQWNAITDRLGRDKQIAKYKDAMGIK